MRPVFTSADMRELDRRAVADLGIPSATFARKVEAKDGTIRIERQTEGGYDVVECELPALVTVRR